jgi:hypothetical protein
MDIHRKNIVLRSSLDIFKFLGYRRDFEFKSHAVNAKNLTVGYANRIAALNCI